LAVIALDDGRTIEAHLGDRGRLERIVVPGAEVHVAPAQGGTKRKTAFTLVCIRCAEGPLICLDPAGANRLARSAIEAGLVRAIPRGAEIASEVKSGRSRFDFLIKSRRSQLFVEVKNVGVAERGRAFFPDAPSERATRHALELARLVAEGNRAMLLFVTQRPEVRSIRPHPIDPEFASSLSSARRAGVDLRGIAFRVELDGFHFEGSRPVEVM
jgi:sugar fermentation stimulation protein A